MKLWLTLSECKGFIDYLKNSLDKDWLDSKIQFFDKYYNTPKNTKVYGSPSQFHPIAFLIYNSEKHLDKIKNNEKIPISEEILRTAILGYIIYQLKNSGAKGLIHKIKELMSSNHEQIEKTKYEMEIARLFAVRGHKIEFVEAGDHKTPDLLLNNSVEVECKRKDKKSKEQKINEDFFKQLVDKSHKTIRDIGSSFIITVKTDNLTQRKVDQFVHHIYKLITKEKEGSFQFIEGKLEVKKLLNRTQYMTLNKKVSEIAELSPDLFNLSKQIIEKKEGKEFWHKLIAENKHFVSRYKINHSQDGTIVIQALDLFILDSPSIPSKYENVINSIKKAKKQLSEKYTNIIFVDMDYNPETVEYDYERISPLVEDILRQNRSISSIVVTVNINLRDDGKIAYYYDGKSYYNKQPIHPIKDNYEIFNQLISPVYTSQPKMQTANPENSDSATFTYICVDCRNKNFIQARFSDKIPLLQNYSDFPQSDIFSCKFCGSKRNLADARRLIEGTTKKKILSNKL